MLFTNPKIVSQRIQFEIPEWTQNLLWYLIESMEVNQKDEIQLFVLSSITVDGEQKQQIIHSQQQPPYFMEHTISASTIITAKVLAVDCQSHSVMIMC
ncbi:DUF960 domain-containing protein [Paenibacillus doosanensis]|uniref:DUF960 domain-containing protein n=1 Tax=Paenibacillus doosanensis TaxID=1229154 RepID=UPI00217FFC85|nr:DUF960 domain-containing protein [Paenibacillus doosanensis]MCS7460832.1 DUF960 domain-containing protein [Paenibacillus doosanensis]